MKYMIRKCPKCNIYTLHEKCPRCGAETISPHPPKFTLDDKYVRYRVLARKMTAENS
ncbi:MAG: RNA-protein complex protein Nop10 [Sulfolobales archaeon]